MDLTPILAYAESAGRRIDPDRLALLTQFHTALYEANSVMNLTRISEAEAISKHYLDSLVISQWIPEGARVLDVGTGPGIPAWPLAWFRPDVEVVAMDGSNKGLAFLRTQPLPNLTVLQVRAEESSRRESFDFVTGRALAPLPIQMELAAAFAVVGGLVVPFRTPAERGQVTAFPAKQLGLELSEIAEAPIPGTDIVRLFPIFIKRKSTPAQYPRPWGKMKQRPLA